MSFSVEYSSGLSITHLIIFKAALILAVVVRWIFSSAIRFMITYRGRVGFRSSSNSVDASERLDQLQRLLQSLTRMSPRRHRPPPPPHTTTTLSMVSDDDQAVSADSDSDDDDDQFGQMMMMLLHTTTYEDIVDRLPESCTTCAVCLDELRKPDKVRKLRNCCHVFHKRCIDRWLNHDQHHHHHHHPTCPVCRTPIMRSSSSAVSLTCRSEPSWAVERILYLFGDDLHPLL